MFETIKRFLKPGEKTEPMNPELLIQGGRLIPAAIDAAPGDAAALKPLLATAAAPAAAIIAGNHAVAALVPDLLALLPKEGLPGRAAAWALGRLGAEAQLLAAVETGGLDLRDNAYAGLAVLAAAGKAGAGLGAAMRTRVDAELAKVKSGGTCLAEHAVRVLAVLGDAETGRLAQAVLDGDRFCDRFELQRIKKSVADGGRHSEAAKQFGAPWSEFFADHLVVVAPPPKPAEAPAKAPAPAPAPMAEGEADVPPGEEGEGPPPPAGVPVDWKAFMASPEVAALPPQFKQLATQLCPLLEQLANRAVGAQLGDLNRDEFAAMLLQVLPQALPPQHVQAALSPQAMICYQAMAKFLIRTGVATQGDALLQGVKFVRQAMTEQIKRAGILNGPDYSDPDEKKPVIK